MNSCGRLGCICPRLRGQGRMANRILDPIRRTQILRSQVGYALEGISSPCPTRTGMILH